MSSYRMIEGVAGFDWDDNNRAKCQKHGVSVAEIENLFAEHTIRVEPDVAHSESEQRFRAVGISKGGRRVFLVFTLRHREASTLIRPISARYMHRKEIDDYEKEVS